MEATKIFLGLALGDRPCDVMAHFNHQHVEPDRGQIYYSEAGLEHILDALKTGELPSYTYTDADRAELQRALDAVRGAKLERGCVPS